MATAAFWPASSRDFEGSSGRSRRATHPQRHFVVAGFVIASGIALAGWHRRGPVQMALVVLLAGGIAVDFFLAPRPA